MKIIHKFARIENDTKLGDRQIRLVASDATPDREGDIVEPSGGDMSGYNGVVLAQHNPENPIGLATPKLVNNRIEALIDFAPAGVSAKADEYCGLAKAGIISSASIGFRGTTFEPLRGGGRHFTKWNLLEISLVSVPANPSAQVVERSTRFSSLTERSHPAPDGPVDYPVKTALDAWLKIEYPDLSWRAAYAEHCTELDCLTGADRKDYIKRWRINRRAWEELQIDRAVEKRLRDMQTPEETEAERRNVIERLAPPAQPFRWDPSADGATNMYQKRIYDLSSKSWVSR